MAVGAHVDLHLGNGCVRPYSVITALSSPKRYAVAVQRDAAGRGGAAWLHDSARVGQVLQIGAPRNHFAVAAGDGPVLLLAGGIGITPIYSMLEELERAGRAVRLHYWCRSPEHALFGAALQGRTGVSVHYSADGERACRLADALAAAPADAAIYCCGPARMLDELASLAAGRAVHVERFAPAPTAPAADAAPPDAYTVERARSQKRFTVQPRQTILEVLLAEGMDVLYSCGQGVRGACEVRVLDGVPVHADSVYAPADHARRWTMMICCSRSASPRLVLDL
ncbi:PDR/VanB family oxidoreductase [Xylophilus sp. ASV27]|uniref:PDR/VanB family oxidoreductase n=1 Tax=Xylophilus sp. ASV27 TaxID=2795129 RepID=UPI0018EA4F97